MSVPAAIANSLWAMSSLPALRRFEVGLSHPLETQERLLFETLSRNADTAFGRKHGFPDIRTYDDFTRQVPLATYEDLQPWIERIMTGESGVLASEPVTHLVPTSGSSGARKLIPFTAGLQRQFDAAIGPWIADLFRSYPRLMTGEAYWSVSPATTFPETERSAVPIGFDDDSAYLGGFRRKLVESIIAVPSSVRFERDIEAFRYQTLLHLVRRRDLRLISVWHPSFFTMLLDALVTNWESLRTIHPRLAHTDPHEPHSIWPKLGLISAWGHGSAAGTLEKLGSLFPNALIQPKGILATEGCVTIPFLNAHPLAVCSHFYEFLDCENRVRLAHELQLGGEYEIILTTAAGLYRYRLGDRVRVSDFVHNTPSLTFLGRAGNVSDYRGEKISEAFAASVLREIAVRTGVSPVFAMLAPEEVSCGLRYVLFWEGPFDSKLAEFLDELLCKNPHYDYCRRLGQLQPPIIVQVTDGYEKFVARLLTHGLRLGDIKPVPLSNRTGWTRHFIALDTGRVANR